MLRYTIAALILLITAHATLAEIRQRPGWVTIATKHGYAELITRLKQAANTHKLGIVSQASATIGAKKVLGKTIPGNMVIGLYHPRFAVPMLESSVAAGIEAPIRVYITENSDQTATLSYKTPSYVFAPYMVEGGDKLKSIATELDAVFDALARQATAK